jgi:hypothetical protein
VVIEGGSNTPEDVFEDVQDMPLKDVHLTADLGATPIVPTNKLPQHAAICSHNPIQESDSLVQACRSEYFPELSATLSSLYCLHQY